MPQTAFTTVTLRRLPQGETLQITISGNKSLNILKDKDSGAEIPALSTENPLVLTPRVYGTSGVTAQISNASWTMDGGSVPSAVGTYTNTGILTIKSSPIGKVGATVHPIMLVFSADATLNGHTYKVEKSLVLQCSEISQNSYWGAIEASNGTTLDDTIDSTTLTPSLFLGTSEVTSAYTVKWFKTGAGAGGTDIEITSDAADKWTLSGNNLTVLRGGVDAAAHFEAHYFIGADEVEAEGVSIVDITDTLQIITEGDSFVSENSNITMKIRAYNTNTGSKLTIPDADAIDIVASDSIRQNTFPEDTYSVSVSNGEGVFTMNESKWRVPNNGSDKASKPWIKCAASAADDVAVANIADASICEVTLLIGVTLDL